MQKKIETRGRKKGTPKTGGRKAGTPNKVRHDIKVLAQGYGPDAIKRLYHLALNADSESVQVSAARELLDRGYGKALAQIAHTGKDESPIQTQDISMLELARRSAFLMVMADREREAKEQLEARTIPGEAVNLTAQKPN